MWVEWDSSSTKTEVGKWEELSVHGELMGMRRELPQPCRLLDSEGTGNASSIDVPADEELTATPAALGCLEIPSSLTFS